MLREWSLPYVKRLLGDVGVNYAQPGFYDSAAFVEEERKDSDFLETYAAYVLLKPYAEEYLARARSIVSDVCAFLFERLCRDGRLGACVDVAGTVSRFLDRQGVWNFPARGCLTISFSNHANLSPRHFAPLESDPNVSAAHMWVIAPPFRIVDLTVQRQAYPAQVRQQLPDFVLAERSRSMTEDAADWFGPDGMRRFRACTGRWPTMSDVEELCGDALRRSRRYGTSLVDANAAQFRYTPCAMFAPDLPLDEMRNLCLSGEYPAQLYERFLESRSPS